MEGKRKRWSPEEIMQIVKRTLRDREDISKVCQEMGCQPSQVYKWQTMLLSEGGMVFGGRHKMNRKARLEELERIALLEDKLQRKNEVLSELMEEHVRLKKSLGES